MKTGKVPSASKREEVAPDETAPSIWNPLSARCQLTILMLAAIMASALARNTISMGIVCMVNSTQTASTLDDVWNVTSSDDEDCGTLAEENIVYEGELVWNGAEKGYVISAIYWGGLLTALPAGYLADRYSPKMIVSLCLIVTMVGCFLTPVAAVYGGVMSVFAIRFLMGLAGQATIYAQVTAMSARWIPTAERSSVIAIYSTGTEIAAAISAPFNAFLCLQKNVLGGWPSIFYFNSLAVALVLLVWHLAAADTPEEYKRIKTSELDFIQESLREQHFSSKKPKWSQVPWLRILTSPAVIVILLGHFATTCKGVIVQSYLPLYFKEALKLDLQANGAFSAIVFVSHATGKFIFASLADYLRGATKLSPTWVCKIFNSVGNFGPAIFLVATAFMTCHQSSEAVAFIAVATTFSAGVIPGFWTSQVSIAPRYTGIVAALSYFAGQIGAVGTPLVVGAITLRGTVYEWRIVFFVIAGIKVLAGLLFLAFGSASIQSWARKKDSASEKEGLLVKS